MNNAPSDAAPIPEQCSRCGNPVGAGQEKNITYYCDKIDGMWCGECFGFATKCEKLHGEGCATVCFAAIDLAP